MDKYIILTMNQKNESKGILALKEEIKNLVELHKAGREHLEVVVKQKRFPNEGAENSYRYGYTEHQLLDLIKSLEGLQ